jgi:5-methylcytosine-specific restriction endonuclease McrA
VPTDQDRELVRSLTAALVPQREIRQRLSKPVSIITFRKHFREEIGVQPPSGIYWEKPQPGQTIYAANKKMLLARELARRKAKPELFIALSSKRRARKRAAVGTFTAADITDIRRLQRDKCAACRRPLRGKGDIDHIIALSGGGSNDRRNLQLLCHSCNSSKQARHPIEFMQSRGFLI